MFRLTSKVLHMTTHPHHLTQALGSVLTAAIKEDRRTQRDVSERSGVPLVTLNRKLLGRRPFTVLELAAICDVLNLSLTDVVLRAERAVPVDTPGAA